MRPITFELRQIAVNGWSVAASTESLMRIFCCPDAAKEYARVAARGRRALLVTLDADGTQLSSSEINAQVESE